MSDVLMTWTHRARGRSALALLLFCVAPTLGQARLRFGHNPALSPDGKLVAFDWCGDLWVVAVEGGAATRLTSHPARDSGPCYSPDGSLLAFTSDRAGGADVFVMPAGGGEPRRLTFHAASDAVNQFTPDGREILFASRRWGHPADGMRTQFVVPVGSGTPRRVQRSLGSTGALSPDGTKLAYVRYGSSTSRRGFVTPANGEIYLHDLLTDVYTRLTKNWFADESPLWSADGRVIYFVSERDGATRNLWKMPSTGGKPEPLTRHSEQVKAPSISRDGRMIAYECDNDIYLLSTANGDSRLLAIAPPSDRTEPLEIFQTITSGTGEYAVAPSGKEVAFCVRGDIYVARFPDGGPTSQITNTPEEESGITWSPDSKTLWFVSDKAGQTDLYSVTSGDATEPRLRHTRDLRFTQQTATPQNESGVTYSPDNSKLLFLRGKGQVVVANPDLTGQKVVIDHWHWPDVVWSPDSRWLAYAAMDRNQNYDVWIIPADGGTACNVSQHPRSDYSPAWTGDGKQLLFLSDRANEQLDVYYVWLRKADYEQTRAQREEAEDDAYDKPKTESDDQGRGGRRGGPPAGGPPPQAAGGGGVMGGDQPTAPFEIDFDQIHTRLVQLTRSIDNESWLSAAPRGDQFAYTRVGPAGRELVVRSIEGGERPIGGTAGAAGVSWMPDGRRVVYLNGGTVGSAALPRLAPEAVSFSAAVRREIAAERAYIFEAAWQTMQDEFYDPNFHGCNWTAMRAKYAPRAAAAPSRDDFDAVINEMLGELNASHCGFDGATGAAPGAGAPPPPAGDLGVVWTDDRSGSGLTVESTVPDSPAARQASLLEPGDRVLSVDGTEITPSVNVNELLINKTGQTVTLQVLGSGGRRTVKISPISTGQVESLAYDAWVRHTQAEVDRLSGGRLGWVHIPSMSQQGVEIFVRDLHVAGAGKDGMLVDVRWNGGGSTADIILNMLGWQPHAITVPRDGLPGYPMNERLVLPPWAGKAGLLCNYNSISNAEILAHAFQVLQRGPVIGTPSYGGVISTGARRLLDGSSIRVPGRGWYRMDNNVDEELHPVIPEVEVWITPEDEAAGRDPQIEAAVKALLATLD